MNNFIFDELAAKEYRNDRMAEAKAHNEAVKYRQKTPIVSFYCALSPFFKKLVATLQNRNKSLAIRDKTQ